MVAFAGSTTIWLLVTNVVLGLAVLVCGVLIGWSVCADMKQMKKERRDEALIPADYLRSLRDLGVTVSISEEQIDEMEQV